MDLLTQARQILDQVEGLGVSAALSEADLPGEGLLLIPPALFPRALGGCWNVTWTAYVLVLDSGLPAVFASAGPLLSKLLPLLGFTEAYPVEIASVTGGRRPGYRVTFTTKLENTL